jgi:hypothetical protein
MILLKKRFVGALTVGLAVLILIGANFTYYKIFNSPIELFAQTQTTNINDLLSGFRIEEQITLNVSPLNPKPGTEINFSLEAYGTDLNKATITWSVNGATKSSGIGIKTFKTQAGSYGQTLTIRAVVRTEEGQTVTKTVSVSSQDIDILWEADSYVPPFYEGRPLYGQEGTVRLVAMPNIINKSGVRVNPSTLVYKWIVDDRVLGSKSGYGRNILEYTGSILGQDNLFEVEVTAPDGTTGRAIIQLSTQEPRTVFYESSPLYGVLSNRAVVDGYTLKDKDIRVEAFPYFFSAVSKSAVNLNYSWFLNDTPLPIPEHKNSAVFRNTNNQSGSTEISVITENTTQSFQRSQARALLNF